MMTPFEWVVGDSSKDHTVTALTSVTTSPVTERYTTMRDLTTAFPVRLLVPRFSDHSRDPSTAQQGAVSPRGVRLVCQHRVRGGARPPHPVARDPNRSEQVREHLRVAALARPDGDDHGTSLAVAQLMDLRRQTATRSPDRMIDRLGHLHHVIRWSPPRGAWCSSRAGGHARWSNRPQHPNRSRPWCLPWSTRPSGPCPRSRRLRSGGAASTPSATDRTPQAGPATQRRSGSGR